MATTNTQVTERPPQQPPQQNKNPPIVVFRERLMARRDEIAAALVGSKLSADLVIRDAITAVQTTPALLTDVPFASFWRELLKACRDRLRPDGEESALVPMGRDCKYMRMYRGRINRFQRSGEAKWIGCGFHRDDDLAWDQWVDETGPHFLHRPGPGKGKIIETYAAATTKTGGFFITVISDTDMERIRNFSRANRADAPWKIWPEPMMLKTAVARLSKFLPVPQDEDDDDDFGTTAAQLETSTPPTPAPRPRGAMRALENFAEDPQHGGEEPPPPDHVPESQQRDPQQQAHDEATGEVIEETTTTTTTTSAPNTPAQETLLIETAYERGKEAKKEGVQRRAIPGEYRDPKRGKEAVAWQRGWDGEPPPKGGEGDAG